ncbi:MAG: hypothetical protein ACR2ID_04490 [Chthoniobacterales bacterium]
MIWRAAVETIHAGKVAHASNLRLPLPEGWKLVRCRKAPESRAEKQSSGDQTASGKSITVQATPKGSGELIDELTRPETASYLSQIEQSIVHYGSSTGFFGKKMFANGPQYLSAAVLYENMAIESYSSKYKLPFPVVAIYPKEGVLERSSGRYCRARMGHAGALPVPVDVMQEQIRIAAAEASNLDFVPEAFRQAS